MYFPAVAPPEAVAGKGDNMGTTETAASADDAEEINFLLDSTHSSGLAFIESSTVAI